MFDVKRSTYEKNYESGLNTVKSLVSEFDKFTDQQNSVGVCIPGFSSYETGLVNNANCIWIKDKPFHKDLEKSFYRTTIKLLFRFNCIFNSISKRFNSSFL